MKNILLFQFSKLNKFCLWFLIIIISFSCKDEEIKTPLEKPLLSFLNKNVDLNDNDIVLVIPNSGCDGCINSAESFLEEYSFKSKNMKFIFTEVTSLKVLKTKFDRSLKSKNVLIDASNEIKYGELKDSFYPAIVYLKNKKIKETEYINPNNPNALSRLLDKIQIE